ncbi:MAG: DUF4037 domain-containing protein [Armatimonadetes bacterium]|nr:DUF4037 domain-containing protein [Armatimonadota bacterium]
MMKDLAQRIAAYWKPLEYVDAIVLEGSACPEDEDEYGDLDLVVYCDCLPEEEEARQILMQMGAKELYFRPDYVAHFIYSDVWVDLAFDRSEEVVRILEESREGECSLNEQHEIASILGCILLHDPYSLVREWQSEAEIYPQDLKERIVEDHFANVFTPGLLRFMQNLVRRNDIAYLGELCVLMDHFIALLYALNERYYSGWKHLDRCLETFSQKPEDCFARMSFALRESDPLKSWRTFLDLITDACPFIHNGCSTPKARDAIRNLKNALEGLDE